MSTKCESLMGQMSTKSKSKCKNIPRYTLLIYQDEEPFINPLNCDKEVTFTCLYYDEHKKRFIEVYIYEDKSIFYDVNNWEKKEKIDVTQKWKNKFKKFMINDLDKRGIALLRT